MKILDDRWVSNLIGHFYSERENFFFFKLKVHVYKLSQFVLQFVTKLSTHTFSQEQTGFY